jgi:hypothetical protein
MTAQAGIIPKTKVFVDQQTHTLVFTRTLPCSAAAAFDAWTQPGQVTQWWDPTGKPLRECRIDLRVGGSFSFVKSTPRRMRSPGRTKRSRRPGGSSSMPWARLARWNSKRPET